ncbi:MAG: nuclease-related domain-containing protein, partial [Clostridia bacterium]
MATMIDQRPSFHGEALLWDKLKEFLPSQDVVYNNREINGREFDVCVLLGNSGIMIIEVKGWRSDIVTVNGVDQIIVEGYATPQRSPKKQARAYRFALLNKIKEKYNLSPLVFDMVCYPLISEAEYHAKRLDIISETQFTIFQEDLETADKILR